jgi:predicted TIM-barrel fold metal-dependent hydrolase
MIIDAHSHVWSRDILQYPWQPILAHVPAPTIDAPVEMLLADMDRAGVDRIVLVQPSVYGWDNRYLMTCLATWPQRFVGICLIDPRSARPHEDLARWCGPDGCKGLRFNLIRQGDASWLASDERWPLFEAVTALRLSLSFHMDIDQAPVIATLAAHYPSTPFIVDYLGASIYGRSDAGSFLDLLAARENVCFKLLCVAEDARTPTRSPTSSRSTAPCWSASTPRAPCSARIIPASARSAPMKTPFDGERISRASPAANAIC